MQVPYVFRAVFFVAITFFALVSVIGNVLEIITFLTTKHLRTSTNYYITSMAVSDLLYVVTNWRLYSNSRHTVFQHSVSSFICQLGMYLSFVSYSVSISSLVLISVDRFVAIVFPLKVTMITGRIRAICILLTWIIPLGIFFPYFQFSRIAGREEGLFLCATDLNSSASMIYYTLFSLFYYCLPLIVITILHSRIVKSLRRPNPVIQGNSRNNTTRRKQNQRIMKIVISINVVFFICWTVIYIIMFILKFSGDWKAYMLIFYFFACYCILSFVSTAGNPVILFTFSTNYRQALKNCLSAAFVNCRSRLKNERATNEDNNIELPGIQIQ